MVGNNPWVIDIFGKGSNLRIIHTFGPLRACFARNRQDNTLVRQQGGSKQKKPRSNKGVVGYIPGFSLGCSLLIDSRAGKRGSTWNSAHALNI